MSVSRGRLDGDNVSFPGLYDSRQGVPHRFTITRPQAGRIAAQPSLHLERDALNFGCNGQRTYRVGREAELRNVVVQP